MERRHFQHFVTVVDSGSISAAARRLHISQPAVSQSIRELERSLRTPLFVRGRQLTLTPAGRALVGPARQTLRSFDTARAAVDAVEALHVGRLDIAVVHGMSVDPLTPLLIRLRRRYPDLSTRILHAPFGTAGFEMLRRGEAELLLTDYNQPFPRHTAIPVPVSETMVAAFAPTVAGIPDGDVVTLAELISFPLIIGLPEKSSSQELFVSELAKADLPMPTAAVATDHRDLIVPLLLAGVGVAVLSGPEGEYARGLGAIMKRIDVPALRSATLYHRHDPLSPVARAFVSTLGTS